jgi:hypothetical protein
MNNESPLSEIVFSRRSYKFLLFLLSYMFAVLAVLMIFSIRGDDIQPGGAALIPASYIFPVGFVYLLHSLFPNSEVHNLGFYIGWLAYLFITICAIAIQNRRTARILYFVFVALLFLNIYGCTIASN